MGPGSLTMLLPSVTKLQLWLPHWFVRKSADSPALSGSCCASMLENQTLDSVLTWYLLENKPL